MIKENSSTYTKNANQSEIYINTFSKHFVCWPIITKFFQTFDVDPLHEQLLLYSFHIAHKSLMLLKISYHHDSLQVVQLGQASDTIISSIQLLE